MWWSVLLLIMCFGIIVFIMVYNPDKIDVLNRIIDRDLTEYSTVKPKKAVTKKKIRHDPPEILTASPDGPEDLEEPVPREGGSTYKNEERCRTILEKLYKGHKFHSVRPTWLRNPATNRCLELDCYCHDLRLALEYQGKQHYQKTKFHDTKKDVIYQFRKDQWKAKRCQELGITLLQVPYWVRPEELENYIKQNLVKVGKLEN